MFNFLFPRESSSGYKTTDISKKMADRLHLFAFSRTFVLLLPQLLCDKVSLELLKGATVDYQEDLMRAAFVVNDNPNAGSSCGCGSSFSVKS